MQEQDLFFAKTTMPNNGMLVGRVFAVKSVEPDGSVAAFMLARTAPDAIEDMQPYVLVKRSPTNLFKTDTCVDVSTEFIFPADWKMIKNRGTLTPEDYTAIIDRHTQYNQANQAVQHHVAPVDAAAQKEALKDMFEEIAENFQRDPEKINEYIEFRAKFYNYSPRNCMLILHQNRYASFVGSYGLFKSMGYNVKPDEYAKAIEILAGSTKEYIKVDGKLVELKNASRQDQIRVEKGEIESVKFTQYFPTYTYDISQTDCPKEDYPKVLSMGKPSVMHNEFYQAMKQLAQDSGIPVEEKELRSITLHGFYDREAKDITINSRLDDTAKATVIVHEFAHGLLHQTSKDPTSVKEFEAQALALTILRKYDFPLEENERSYLTSYFKSAQKEESFDLEKSISCISKQVDFIDRHLSAIAPASFGFEEPKQDQKRESKQKGKAQGKSPAQEMTPADILENFTQAL